MSEEEATCPFIAELLVEETCYVNSSRTMDFFINEMFLFSSLITFSSEEISGGDGATIFFVSSVLSEPPSCSPLGVASVERNQHLEKNKILMYIYICTT